MVSVKKTVAYFLDTDDEQELQEFALWAFGEGYQEIAHALDFMEAWNLLHGEDLRLREEGYIHIDVPRMVELWKEELLGDAE